MKSNLEEKWKRLTNPKTCEDYGLRIDLKEFSKECPEIFNEEIAPFLPIETVSKLQEKI